MRIALITDAWWPQINGVVTTLSRVVEHWREDGHDVRVIEPGGFRTIPCPKYPDIRLSLLPGRGVRRSLDEFQPHAIHIATEGPLGMAGRRYCRRRGLPFTTSYHTQFALYARAYFGIPPALTYRVIRWFHGAAKCTLVPTPSVRDELVQRGMSNIIVWTRGVDTELFRPRDKHLLKAERPVFMYVGRIAREKNIQALLDADLPGSVCVIGDGPELPRLRAQYPKVHFLGYKTGEDLARWFATGDVFVFPSRTDTFGVVMLEAMACGMPIAAYPVTGPIDVVRPGETGVLHDDLAEAARQALKLDPNDCRKQAVEHSWSRCAAMLFDHLAAIERNDESATVTAPAGDCVA